MEASGDAPSLCTFGPKAWLRARHQGRSPRHALTIRQCPEIGLKSRRRCVIVAPPNRGAYEEAQMARNKTANKGGGESAKAVSERAHKGPAGFPSMKHGRASGRFRDNAPPRKRG